MAEETQTSQPRHGIADGPTIVPPGDTSESAVSEMAERPASAGTPAPETKHRFGVLRHRHFRNVWFAAFGSSVGTWMEHTGMQWALTTITLAPEWVGAGKPGAPIMAGYLAVAQMAPTLLLGIVGGIVADRVDRKKLLLISQFFLMVVAGVLTVATYTGHLTPTLLLALGATNGVLASFNIPAWQVLTPRLVPRNELTAAVTLNGIQFNLARVIGPALGGILMAQFGAGVLFTINTISFLGVILAVASTPAAPPPPRDGTSALGQVREAFSYCFTRRGPLMLILAISLFSLLGTPLLRMLPILVHEVYHKEEGTFGTMLAALGVGAVAGGFLMRLIPKWYPKHHLIPASMALGGASIAIFVTIEDSSIASLAMIIVGVFWLLSFNPAFAALQMLVEDRIRGRVMAVCNMISFGAMPVGTILCGSISQWVSGRSDSGFGTQVGVGVLSVLLTAVGIGMLTWRTPEIDGLKPGDPGYDKRPGLLRGITARAHRPAPSQT